MLKFSEEFSGQTKENHDMFHWSASVNISESRKSVYSLRPVVQLSAVQAELINQFYRARGRLVKPILARMHQKFSIFVESNIHYHDKITAF
jgi:hypothetical protein